MKYNVNAALVRPDKVAVIDCCFRKSARISGQIGFRATHAGGRDAQARIDRCRREEDWNAREQSFRGREFRVWDDLRRSCPG